MKAIAAMDQNRGIGKNGGLPWPSIKEDFKWFKEFTNDKILVMGKRTFDTLPLLKNRYCICVNNKTAFKPIMITNPQGMEALNVSQEFVVEGLRFVKEWNDKLYIVAGGAKTYESFLPHINEFYVTHINGVYDADTFMPPFEHWFNKQEVVKEFDGHKVVKYTK